MYQMVMAMLTYMEAKPLQQMATTQWQPSII
jgi:hypothetical protein